MLLDSQLAIVYGVVNSQKASQTVRRDALGRRVVPGASHVDATELSVCYAGSRVARKRRRHPASSSYRAAVYQQEDSADLKRFITLGGPRQGPRAEPWSGRALLTRPSSRMSAMLLRRRRFKNKPHAAPCENFFDKTEFSVLKQTLLWIVNRQFPYAILKPADVGANDVAAGSLTLHRAAACAHLNISRPSSPSRVLDSAISGDRSRVDSSYLTTETNMQRNNTIILNEANLTPFRRGVARVAHGRGAVYRCKLHFSRGSHDRESWPWKEWAQPELTPGTPRIRRGVKGHRVLGGSFAD
ncbi:hypothetical protein EVAR_19255_1 [Eumeta japonica]|uniref:Uncharacterized protein n=1 Tax=Eumeta variegata TaxID=151549 RepID=A0A4C1UD58_EUMVA|nr:hypothetical protein EVAR_19255_1 [Eumeta japonica]